MARFFISYSRKNKSLVRLLRKKLDGAEHRSWVDSSDIGAGQNYQVAIDEAIRQCDALLAIFSNSSIENRYVNYEWAYALGAGVPVIPMMLDRVSLHPRLDAINSIDIRPGNRRRWNDIIRSLDSFEKARCVGVIGMGSTTLKPAIVARFELGSSGRPRRVADSREWQISLHIRAAGATTKLVKYEILDDTFTDPKWKNVNPSERFSDDISSYGDVVIKAKGFAGKGEAKSLWATESTLYRALLRGHAGRRSEAISKALDYIRTH